MENVQPRTIRGYGNGWASAEDAVRVLNEALKADPDAVAAMLRHVPHNGSLAPHPTIQVASIEPEGQDSGRYHISFLGLLNGMFGVHPGTNYGLVCVVLDDVTKAILRFELTKPEDGMGQQS